MKYSRVSDPNDHLFFNEDLNAGLTQAKKEINAMMKANIEAQKQIPQVVMQAVHEAVNKLRVTNCAFKIMLPDGEIVEHGMDRLEPKKAITRNRTYKHGELKERYYPYVANLQVGEVAEIPYDDAIPFAALQSSATAFLSLLWGNGSYTSSTNKEKQVLEILRLR